jgi:hypothetical protein
MKLLTAVAALVLSLATLASSDTKTFYFDGTQESIQLSLRAEETHIEYRYEQRRTICYRTEVYYDTVCTGHPRPSCYPRPVTRTIAYSCIQTVRVPYEVKDYDVEAIVDLAVEALPGTPPGETFSVTLDEDRLSISALSLGRKNMVILKKEEISSSTAGTVKFFRGAFAASVREAGPVLAALSITDIGMRNPVLSFSLGPVAVPELIGFRLTVKKAPVLGTDTVLLDRDLADREITLAPDGAGSLAEVDVERLGVELRNGRYSLTAKTYFKDADALLNRGQFAATSAARTLLFKVR